MPGVTVKEFDLAAYLPAGSNAIVGVLGPATKGPVNELNQFTDEGNFINTHGRPINYQYAVRGAIRYLRYGNQLKFVRVAGTLLRSAFVEQWKEVAGTLIPLLRFEAASPGTWANEQLKINIFLNGNPATSFDIVVIFFGRTVETHQNLTMSTVENVINSESNYIRVIVHPDAGTTLPDSTLDSTIEQYVPMVFAHGDDGAFASSKSEDSSTGGVSARNNWGYTLSANGTLNYAGSEGRAIAPGSFSVSTTAPVAENFTDDGRGNLTGSVSGTGKIDYQTGEWNVTFDTIPTADVVVAYNSATYEVIGSSSSTALNDSGVLNRFGVKPSFISIRDPRLDRIDIGDGGTANYVLAALATNIVPGSIEITTLDTLNNEMIVTDDGNGSLTGSVGATSTINYITGALNVTFNANVKNLENIYVSFKVYVRDDGAGALSGDRVAGTINYQTGAWTLVHTFVDVGNHSQGLPDGGSIEAVFKHGTILDFGDNTEVTFQGILREYPVKPGSVSIVYTAGPALTDDDNGNIIGAGGSGVIDYNTGEITVTFTGAPASGFPIQVYYDSIIYHFTSIHSGDIGNQREVLEDGIYVWIDKSPNTPTTNPSEQWYRIRVFFPQNGGASTAVETFDALRTLQEMMDTINNSDTGSKYIRMESLPVEGEPDTSVDGNLGQKIGMAGAFSNSDLIGTHVVPNYTGLQLFSNPEVVPCHFLTAPGQWHRQIQLAGINLCERRRCVWIFSIPDFDSPYDARDFVNGEYNASAPGGIARPTITIPYPPLATIDSSHAFCQFSWLKYYDQYADEEVWEPGEGDIYALISRVDQNHEPWYPIAGLRRGKIGNISDLRYAPEEGERKAVYGRSGTRVEVVNCFVKFVGQGIYLYGQRTMARDPKATDRLHVRWTANILANSLILTGRRFPFELNDEVLWREIKVAVKNVVAPIAAKRGIYDYRIVCDATTNTPEVIGNEKKAICKIFIKWTEAAEEIEFQMIYTPVTSDFSEVAPVG